MCIYPLPRESCPAGDGAWCGYPECRLSCVHAWMGFTALRASLEFVKRRLLGSGDMDLVSPVSSALLATPRSAGGLPEIDTGPPRWTPLSSIPCVGVNGSPSDLPLAEPGRLIELETLSPLHLEHLMESSSPTLWCVLLPRRLGWKR